MLLHRQLMHRRRVRPLTFPACPACPAHNCRGSSHPRGIHWDGSGSRSDCGTPPLAPRVEPTVSTTGRHKPLFSDHLRTCPSQHRSDRLPPVIPRLPISLVASKMRWLPGSLSRGLTWTPELGAFRSALFGLLSLLSLVLVLELRIRQPLS